MKHSLFKAILFAATLIPAGSILVQTQTIRAFSHRGGRMERDENTLKHSRRAGMPVTLDLRPTSA
jgi:hypothetical protein